jgi:hypothetical protein
MSQQATQPAEPIELNDLIATTINSAADRSVPLAVAYVDSSGLPNLSPRGTVQVVGPDQLALWARTSGLPDALAVNPTVALLYQDLANHHVVAFTGCGRIIDDPGFRDRVFEGSPEREQAQDPARAGTAILIEVDSVRGRIGDEVFVMARDAARRQSRATA